MWKQVSGPLVLIVAVCLLMLAVGQPSSAQGGWPTVTLTTVVTGVSNPTFVTNAGDGSGRLFVVEQEGVIRIVQGGSLLPTPFMDINARVSCCGERGLLSIAFPPNYASKRYFYTYYTDNGGSLQISRFFVPSGTPNVADPNSEQKLLTIPHPGYSNHNGGQIAFGPDGYLYIFTGDGGGGGDPDENAQDIESLLGKALRIDVESGTPTASYQIPPDNPFVGVPGRDEIWAYGLRNSWRSTFDRATGDLYIADVGQNQWEEVNVQPAASSGGENYGWDCYEGNHPYEPAGCSSNPADFVFPVTEYSHSSTGSCSITGGYVYRGVAYDMGGIYFYTDYCSGVLWGLRRNGSSWESQQLADFAFGFTSFGEDEAGEIYMANQGSDTVFRLVGPAAATPTPTPTINPNWPKLYLPIIMK